MSQLATTIGWETTWRGVSSTASSSRVTGSKTPAGGPAIVVAGVALGSAGSVSDGTLTPELIPPSDKDPNGVAYVRWTAAIVKSQARFEVTAPSAGSYTLYVSFLKTPEALPVAAFVNGMRAGKPFDPTGDTGVAKVSFGRVELRAGANEIALEFAPAGAKERSTISVAVLQILLEP